MQKSSCESYLFSAVSGPFDFTDFLNLDMRSWFSWDSRLMSIFGAFVGSFICRSTFSFDLMKSWSYWNFGFGKLAVLTTVDCWPWWRLDDLAFGRHQSPVATPGQQSGLGLRLPAGSSSGYCWCGYLSYCSFECSYYWSSPHHGRHRCYWTSTWCPDCFGLLFHCVPDV